MVFGVQENDTPQINTRMVFGKELSFSKIDTKQPTTKERMTRVYNMTRVSQPKGERRKKREE